MEYEKAGTEDNRTWRVWLSEDEQERMIEHSQQTRGTRDRLIIEAGVNSGLRSFEISQITPGGITVERVGEDTVPMVLVPKGKDTRGEGGKSRKTVLPNRDLWDVYADTHDLGDSDPFIDLSARRIQQIIVEVAESLATETGNDDWRKVSSHDLRRSWGHTLLVRKNMNPRAVMGAGGWEDFSTMEEYLRKADSKTIAESFVEATR